MECLLLLYFFGIIAYSNADPPTLEPNFVAMIHQLHIPTSKTNNFNISLDFTNQRNYLDANSYDPTEPDLLNRCKPKAYEFGFFPDNCTVQCWNGTLPTALRHSLLLSSQKRTYTKDSCSCTIANVWMYLYNATLNPSPCESEGQKGQMWDNTQVRYCIGKDEAGKPIPLFFMEYSDTSLISISTFVSIKFGPPPNSTFVTPDNCKPPKAATSTSTSASIPSNKILEHLSWPEKNTHYSV